MLLGILLLKSWIAFPEKLPLMEAPIVANEQWQGELSIIIKSEGKATGLGKSVGTWKILREAKGTIILDRTFRGAGISRTPSPKNTARYETWVSTEKRPLHVKAQDKIVIRGPFDEHYPSEVILDKITYQCPAQKTDEEWETGEISAPILQFDFETNKVTYGTPDLTVAAQDRSVREFVGGTAKQKARKPIVEDELNLGWSLFENLDLPKVWSRLEYKFQPGQTKLDLSGTYPFTITMRNLIKPQRVNVEMKLVLNKVSATP